uniref:Uncharacterized protein n=1 Tax=Geobacter sp. (strain M21) TaxID=443144 RepID=C6E6S1_GEOSM
MGNKNRIAAVLAMMAMVGFLGMLGALCFMDVPATNKDFVNMGFIALIGFVGTAFGYYLGSSQGSAHKNELLAQGNLVEIPLAPPNTKEAGFARLQVMAVLMAMGFLFLIAGCATMKTDSPQITVGKSLLATKQTIVTAAVTADSLCNAGKLSVDKCYLVFEAYEDAKRGYDAAVDAYLLMQTGGDPAQVDAAMKRLVDITTNLAAMTGGAK